MANVSDETAALTTNNVCKVVDEKCETGLFNGKGLLVLTLLVYIFVFLVWGVYSLFDFINERWKRMKWTIFWGTLQAILFLTTMPIALLYIVTAASAEDHTEMSAAIVALTLSTYHLIRTFWGMIQLTMLRRWVRLALQVMHFQGYHLCAQPMLLHTDKKYADQIKNSREDLTANEASQSNEASQRNESSQRNEASKRVDLILRIRFFKMKLMCIAHPRSIYTATLQKIVSHHTGNILVNSSIVDNEFMDTENRFYLNGKFFFDKKSEPLVCPMNLDQCFLRWSVLYLAYYGIPFLQDSNYCRSLVYDLKCSFESSFFVKCLLTQAMLIGNTGEERTSHQQATWESTWATILLCRDEALFASLYDSSCMPSGKMESDLQRGRNLNGYTHRLSRLIDSLPEERFDQNLKHSKTVELVRGISCRDLENFAIFLHSSPLLSVDKTRLGDIIRVYRYSVISFRFLIEIVRHVKDFIKGLPGSIWNWLTDIFKWLYDIFRSSLLRCTQRENNVHDEQNPESRQGEDGVHDVENPESRQEQDEPQDEENPKSHQRQDEARDEDNPIESDTHGSHEAVIDLRIGTSRFRKLNRCARRGQRPNFLTFFNWRVPRIFYAEYFMINDQTVKYDFKIEDEEFAFKKSSTADDSKKQFASGMRKKRQYSHQKKKSVKPRNEDANPESSIEETQLSSTVNISGETSAPPNRETALPDVEDVERSQPLPRQQDSHGVAQSQDGVASPVDRPSDTISPSTEPPAQGAQVETAAGNEESTVPVVEPEEEDFELRKRLLQRQVQIKNEIWDEDKISNLPALWRCGKELNMVQWNSSVPVVSFIIDNIYAIVSGNQYHNLLGSWSELQITVLKRNIQSHIKRIADLEKCETEDLDPKKKLLEANVFIQESVIESGLGGSDSSGIRGFLALQFAGASMQDIMKTGIDSDGDSSRPSLNQFDSNLFIDSEREIRFPVSGMLRDAARIVVLKREPNSKAEQKDGIGERYALESRMIWECQHHLHMNRPYILNDEQSHLHFALLIILSFPTVATRFTLHGDHREPSHLSLSVEPLLAPQTLAVNIAFTNDLSHIEMKFSAPKRNGYLLRLDYSTSDGELLLTTAPEKSHKEAFEFARKDWINAFEGRIKAFQKRDKQPTEEPVRLKNVKGFSVIGEAPKQLSGVSPTVSDADVDAMPTFSLGESVSESKLGGP